MSREGFEQKGLRITGRVQGVYYRVWAQRVAGELGLRGTVRNRLDGSVEAHAVGMPETLKVFETRLWEGPPAAAVDGVEVFQSEEQLPAGPFRILPTV